MGEHQTLFEKKKLVENWNFDQKIERPKMRSLVKNQILWPKIKIVDSKIKICSINQRNFGHNLVRIDNLVKSSRKTDILLKFKIQW